MDRMAVTGRKVTKECQEILDSRVPPGPTGANGAKGEQGAPFPKGESGSSGMLANRNWRECDWKNLDDSTWSRW